MANFDICPDWVRPCEWPDLPVVGPDEEKVVGLVAVEDTDSEFIAVLCEGDYVVDWGDGSELELVDSGVRAEHQYIYASVPGDPICTVSAPSSDYPGHKVVTVTIIPQPVSSSDAGALTKVDFQQRHSLLGLFDDPLLSDYHAHSTCQAKWLDLQLNLPSCTSLRIGPPVYVPTTDPGTASPEDEFSLPNVEHVMVGWLKQVVLRADALTSASGLFSYCFGLKAVSISHTAALTDTSWMFYRCFSLRKVPLFDTSAVTDTNHMFYLCSALMCVPLFDTSSVETMESMFAYCYCLPTIPAYDTSAVTTMYGMMQNCVCLHTMPLLDTSSVTTMAKTFKWCYSLPSVPLFDTSSVTTFFEAFYDCENLRLVPVLDTSGATVITRIFYGCNSLSRIPSLNFAAVSSRTNAGPFVSYCYRLTRCSVSGLRYSHSYVVPAKRLTATALNEIFTNLGTAAGSQTITITGCLGAATCDRTIATAKGWTVTG